MELSTLKQELETDPAGLGYAGKSGAQCAALLNAMNRTLPRTSISGGELLACTTVAELVALTAAARDTFLALIQMDSLDITSAGVRMLLGALFAAGTTTRANLIALSVSTTPVNRATELGLGAVTAANVDQARSGVW